MADLTHDLRYSLRQIRRSPGFFAVASMLIAIGIAATTQIFTMVNAFLLRPLPVRDPQNLAQLFSQQAKRPADPLFDYRFYKLVAAYSSTLYQVAGEMDTTRSLERGGRAERIHAVAVTDNFFTDLGVGAAIGRVLNAGDNHKLVLSYPYWSNSFGRDLKVLGQSVRLQGHPFTIIGVAPRGFSGTTLDSSPDVWMLFTDVPDFYPGRDLKLDDFAIEIIGRLKPGVTITQAQQETAALWARSQPASDQTSLINGKLELHSLAHGVSPIRDQSQTSLLLLLAGTGLLLLMVCANVDGLLLSRATSRERETAVRVALGASQWRILRQWMMESLILSLVGGSAGILLAYATMPWLMGWMPPAHGIGFDPGEVRTLTLTLGLDFRVAAFAIAACLLTALLSALAPAWRSSRLNPNTALKSTTGFAGNRLFQSTLCGLQIALCTTLLISAGLVLRSLSNLRASDAGFDRDHIAEFSIDPHVRGYDQQKTWLLEQRLLDEVRKMPGVEGAALANRGLMRGIGLGFSAVFPGQRGGVVNTSVNNVSTDYFDVMGMHLLAGRTFTSSDIASDEKPRKVVVNEAFVRKFLNGRNPLGAKFDTGQQFMTAYYEIFGVVNDSKYRSLREVPPPIVYTSSYGPKSYPDTFILHVRTHGDPRAIIEPVRKLVRSIDPELPLFQVATLSEEVDRSLWQERLLAAITSCFGAFALVLSIIGIYGIVAYFVARRQREIGVHLALGATSRNILWLVVSRIVPTLAIGIMAGAALSFMTGTWVRSVLYGVEPFDLTTTLEAIGLLLCIGVAAAMNPALRATRVDPSTTLRQE